MDIQVHFVLRFELVSDVNLKVLGLEEMAQLRCAGKDELMVFWHHALKTFQLWEQEFAVGS